jgi:hypothetical protein
VVAFSKTLFRSNLAKKPGLLGLIFRKAQNKVQDPAKLRRLIADLIDKILGVLAAVTPLGRACKNPVLPKAV